MIRGIVKNYRSELHDAIPTSYIYYKSRRSSFCLHRHHDNITKERVIIVYRETNHRHTFQSYLKDSDDLVDIFSGETLEVFIVLAGAR